MTAHLTKSTFVAGWQCPNLLWWEVHEPNAPERVPDIGALYQMEQGQRVGELARSYVPGGTLIPRHRRFEHRLTATAAALASDTPAIYNASVLADGVFVEADVLERRGDGFVLVEVKSSTHVKDEHIPDVAIQAYVLERAGVHVVRSEVMHLNGACRFPDLSDLFVRQDIGERVAGLLPEIPGEIEALRDMLDGPHPDLPFGPQCFAMDACPFRDRCWPEATREHVLSLARVGLREAYAFMQRGIHSIHDLPLDATLSTIAQRQVRSVRRNELVLGAALADALQSFAPPLAFLDFETVRPAIPIWDGCRPWQQIPVQFSCHTLAEDGTITHREWLADGADDPREPLARSLIEVCRGAGHVVAYWASFERTCIQELAEALPHLADALLEINERLLDLHPVVRDHVYHPDFLGSFSLKAVVPALLPGLAYDDLEVSEGSTASAFLAQLLLEPGAYGDAEREELRRDLLAYCERDTLVMVVLLARLRQLAQAHRH